MSPDSTSIFARIRAGVAASLSWLAGTAHRLEEWSSRGSRALVLGLVVAGVLILGAVALFGPGRGVAGWGHGGPRGDRHEVHAHRGGPHDRSFGKPFGRPDGRWERPRPPAPPEAPAPPPPPVAPVQP